MFIFRKSCNEIKTYIVIVCIRFTNALSDFKQCGIALLKIRPSLYIFNFTVEIFR
ncbi:hypothetical protein TPE_1108 [Treponema pedis str. T A4]|uniref:Uncharacterized protein n=1 Tax=Treponema pedis str. T A4 TaxID=1291379 RepID=S6A8C8_9SPIR|nr:hypothetical protein TPE_1108 [Treponema pedis str. T A4]